MTGSRACVLLFLLTCCVISSYGKRISTKDIMAFFETYDTNEPPRLDGSTQVRIGMWVKNIETDNNKGVMRIDIYQRMAWQDVRLQKIFNDSDSDQEKVKFDNTMIQRTWRPDLFIRNAGKADKVAGVTDEHLFRVNRTGHVWYVVRLINDVYCPQLRRPQPALVCDMKFESFSHSTDTLTLTWLASGGVNVDKSIELNTRTIEHVIQHDCTQNYTSGSFPCLMVRWVLRRNSFEMTFDRGVYLVSSLLVIISWLGFWIPPSDKRIFLGLIIALILGGLYNVVAEWREFSCALCTRAAQIWLIFCLCMVLGMVLEFAVVYIVFGTLCTRIRGLCGGKALPEDREPKQSRWGDIIDTVVGLIIFPAVFIIIVSIAGSRASASIH